MDKKYWIVTHNNILIFITNYDLDLNEVAINNNTLVQDYKKKEIESIEDYNNLLGQEVIID